MKKLILILLAVNPCFAIQSRRVIAVTGSAVPAAYSVTNNKSLVMSEDLSSASHLSIFNGTTDFITCTADWKFNSVAPVTDNTRVVSEEIYLPTLVGMTFDNIGLSKQIFCRSDTGVNTGSLILHAW